MGRSGRTAWSIVLPGLVEEYRFHPKRRWRFDYAIPGKKIAFEIEGGLWKYGRHNRPQGYIRDLEKYNWATALGWRVFRLTPEEWKRGDAVLWVERMEVKNER